MIKVVLVVILCLLIFDGLIWIAMLGNLSKICDLLRKIKEDKE